MVVPPLNPIPPAGEEIALTLQSRFLSQQQTPAIWALHSRTMLLICKAQEINLDANRRSIQENAPRRIALGVVPRRCQSRKMARRLRSSAYAG